MGLKNKDKGIKMDAHVKLSKIWERVSAPPQGLSAGRFITQQENHDIHYIYAPSAQKDASKGTVVMTHGYLEYGALYYDTIKRYQELGYHVFMMDFFGFGRSARPYPDKPNMPSKNGIKEHVNDLDDFVTYIVHKHSAYMHDQPLFMSTNSMGGQVGLIYMENNPNAFTGAILSSPLTHVNYLNLPDFCRPLVQTAISWGNKIGLADIPMAKSWDVLRKRNLKNGLTDYGVRDHLIGEIHNGDADMSVSVPSWGWLESTFATSAAIMKPAFLKSIQTPLLWGTAGKDSFIDLKSHYDAVKHIDTVNHVFFPEGIHALWRANNEVLELWWGHIEDFLKNAPHNRVLATNDNAAGQKYTKLIK
jgi:lysophospholipase